MKKYSRRELLRMIAVGTGGVAIQQLLAACSSNPAAKLLSTITSEAIASPTDAPDEETPQPSDDLAPVYLTTEITAAGLLNAYHALGITASGNVAVKVHSGEPGGHYFLQPDFIAPLVNELNGTIVECNTAYGGRRDDTASHQQVMIDHGFSAIAPVDIMDAEGTMSIPIVGGKHLTEDVVGSHFANYDFLVDLAHFKGHMMGGFGGVLKNMSIGIASSVGKSLIHSAGKSTTGIGTGTAQDDFLESMAEAAKGIADYMDGNIAYINVMNNLSVDCDCMGNPSPPTMSDIAILSSLDPVAVDQACVDLVYAADDGGDLVERIESRNGIHILEHAEAIGFGNRNYELIKIA